ncbi:hypothetical protein NQ315_008672 [Exocentrus adspersus]|uniref:Uncharacterized protein n=1 Tax=Exocentrus adspersus TaxID=1586481 RepID=A0AAV8W6T4_9CUCU|nr:hypothetical protein NQ315_008672 [Exocentrus adspersus]
MALLVGGRFQLVRNENFWQHLAALGIPEGRAKEVDATKPILEVQINGREVTISTESDNSKVSSTLILDEEVDETLALNILVQSTTTLSDNELKIKSVGPSGETGVRLFNFTEDGMTMTLIAEDPSVPVAKRWYQKL